MLVRDWHVQSRGVKVRGWNFVEEEKEEGGFHPGHGWVMPHFSGVPQEGDGEIPPGGNKRQMRTRRGGFLGLRSYSKGAASSSVARVEPRTDLFTHACFDAGIGWGICTHSRGYPHRRASSSQRTRIPKGPLEGVSNVQIGR